MRYLPIADVESVLRRGKSVEQFLGKCRTHQTVRCVELRPINGIVEIWVFEVEDIGSSDYLDLYAFPAVGECFEEPVTSCPLVEAMEWSEHNLRASPTRWVNQGVVQSEYAETFA